MDLKRTYSDLNADVVEVKKFLSSQGIQENEIVFDAADISKNYDNQYDENGNFRNVFSEAMSLDSHSKYNPNQWIWLKKTSRGF